MPDEKPKLEDELLAEAASREQVELFRWREDQLVRAGIGLVAACRLAASRIDYYRAVHLHGRGMTDDQLLDQLLD